jgi:pyroglutamyl-peptidase
MKKVLLTGFEPFGNTAHNPSGDIARALHGRTIEGRDVVSAVLPCAFGDAIAELRTLLRVERPELIVCLGLASGRTEIAPERVALNLNDAPIPDNHGQQPVDVAVARGGPAAYWSTLPVKAIVAALRGRSIPAAVSLSAGTFVCNHTFYGLMHALRWQRAIRGGFIHLPTAREHAKPSEPSLPLATMTEAVELAIATSVKTRRDIRKAAGTVA